MPEQEIVIVGTDGTEHVFPAGFDPKKAAGIVAKGATAAPKPASTPEAPASALSRFGSAFLEQVNPVNAVKGLYEQVVHPVDAANARLRAAEAHPFETAVSSSPIGQFGGAHAGTRIAEGDVAGGLGEGAGQVTAAAAPVILPKIPAGVRAGARGAVRAGAVATDLLEKYPVATGAAVGGTVGLIKGGPMGAVTGALEGATGGGVYARVLKQVQKLQAVTGKPPTLADIDAVVRKAPAEEAVLPPGKSPVTGKSAQQTANEEAIAARRARNAAAQTTSQQILAEQPDLVHKFARTMTQDEAGPIYRATDFTKPIKVKVPVSKIVATQDGFQNPIIEQYRLHPGSELPSAMKVGDEYILGDGHHRVLAQIANGATEVELNAHPVDAALRANPQPRAMWLDSGGKPVGGGHVPLSEAVTAVRDAAKTLKPKLTATEFTEATRLTKQGRPASDVMDAIDVQRRLKGSKAFADLPTGEEARVAVAKNTAATKAQSTNPRYGAYQGDYGRDAPTGTEGNPFR